MPYQSIVRCDGPECEAMLEVSEHDEMLCDGWLEVQFLDFAFADEDDDDDEREGMRARETFLTFCTRTCLGAWAEAATFAA